MNLRNKLGPENYDLLMEIYNDSTKEEIDKHLLEAELNLQNLAKQEYRLRLEIELMNEIKSKRGF